jgi:hypothetical protein
MFFEMDTATFLALAKTHQRALQQQAERDALWRREVRRKQGQTHLPRRRLALLPSLKRCLRAVILGCYTLWQRRVLVSKTWTSEGFSQASRTIRG